jgi:hypothetical protein
MTRFLMTCLLALLFSPQESSAQSRVTVSPEGLAAGAAAPVYLNAGGSYEPSARGAATIIHEAPSTDYPVAPPSIEWHFEAAAWGSNGQEAAAFAHADVLFAAAPGATYLNPPPQSGTMSYAGYRASCNPNVNNHCDCSIPTNCTFQTGAGASITRLYRIKNTTTNSLPPDQTFVPLLVDYAHHRRCRSVRGFALPGECASAG